MLRREPGDVDECPEGARGRLVPDEVERLRTLPVSGVMAKPFDPMTLPDELGTVLGW